MTAGKVALAGVLLFLVSFEGVVLARQPTFPHAAVWVSGVLVCVCAVPQARVPLRVRAGAAAVVSWTASLALMIGQRPLVAWGMGEAVALLVLLTSVLRHEPRRRAMLLAPPLALGCVAAPARDVNPGHVTLLFSVLAGVVTVYSLLLRVQADQRVRDVAAVRAFERRELARELHDVVAHHVTGIVVQTRAARFASPDPEVARRTLERVEAEADEALAAMRRLVSLMRDGGEGRDAEGPATAPVAGLSEVSELAAGFSRTGPPVVLDVDPGLEAELPPDTAASVYRLVRESLTNVRKHAHGATSVRVRLRARRTEVELRITDDGRSPGDRGGEEHPAGGFGLVGMAERAAAVGGTLRAGPMPEGGWEVVALLPRGAPRG
ncbi:histidine kinase [Streptomyces sp. HNM0574]|uniref:sensor histidine kinase n=1 Tax=Streptomyces sp. HNM0574 TaxID=2714954 RepID=UPI003216553A